MSHEIEIVDGVARMIFAQDGGLPWHTLGTPIKGDTMYSVAACLKASGTDSIVEKFPLYSGEGTLVSDFFGIRRMADAARGITPQVYGVCGTGWQPCQNADAFAPFQTFLDSGLCRIETMGSLREGQTAWALAKIVDGESEVMRGDSVAQYILLSNKHDGKTSIRFGTTPIRVVCANTEAMAFSNQSSRLLRIRHSTKTEFKLSQVADIISQLKGEFGKNIEAWQTLARKRVTSATLEKYFRATLGVDADKPRADLHGKTVNSLDNLFKLFESGKGSELSRGTLWGAYNAVTENLSWYAGRNADNRYQSLWFGQGANDSKAALDLALSLAV